MRLYKTERVKDTDAATELSLRFPPGDRRASNSNGLGWRMAATGWVASEKARVSYRSAYEGGDTIPTAVRRP